MIPAREALRLGFARVAASWRSPEGTGGRALFRSGVASHATWFAVSALFALAQFRMIMLAFGSNYTNSIDAALGVMEGLPHWRVYQSRILGPWTVELLSNVFGSFTSAYVFFVIATTTVAGWLVLALTRRLFGASAAWSSFLLTHLLFSFLLGKLWLYAWDHYGIIISILFIYFILAEKDWKWFTALFVAAILNRESAYFIAGWMVLDPLIKAALDRAPPRLVMPVAGVLCGAIGAVVVHELRAVLLVREIGPELFHMPQMAGKAFHNQWDLNVTFLRRVVTEFSFGFEILIPVFLVVTVSLAGVLAWRDPRRFLGLALVQTAIVASLLVAAILEETRVMLELVPFVAMGWWAARENRVSL